MMSGATDNLPDERSAAQEAERARLAALLEGRVIEPLALLLAQANAYEQSLSGNPQGRLAASVLGSLAGRALQQVRDLQADLRPDILARLGLPTALEDLAARTQRVAGLRVTLTLDSPVDRFPDAVELALYRLAQAALARALDPGQATQVMLHVRAAETDAALTTADDGRHGLDLPLPEDLRGATVTLTRLGGTVATGRSAEGGLRLAATVPLEQPSDLTPRECDVLGLLVAGLSNRAIGAQLGISHRTVNFHLDNLYAKLGVRTRTEAAILAVQRGLASLPPDDPG